MLVNAPELETKHVKFISYTGKYPYLCNGILTLEIDGRKVTFGDDESCDDGIFWESGGLCYRSNIERGEWAINFDDIPEPYQKYAKEIDFVFNKNVEKGCCGGCI